MTFKFLGRLFVGLLVLTGASVWLLLLFLGWAIMPERQADTAELQKQAPAVFQELTNVPYPENATIARVAWYTAGDEHGLHLILDASRMDLDTWIKAVRPFGKPLERVVPKRSIELNSLGLSCAEDNIQVDLSDKPFLHLVNTACEIMPNPREVWMAQQRVRTDWMRTIIVDEDAKMIWLQGTEW